MSRAKIVLQPKSNLSVEFALIEQKLYGNFGNENSFRSFAAQMELSSIELKIINGARDLFYKHGIRTITMDDIAKHLAVSKKTIYAHFKDKHYLVKQMLLDELHQQVESMKSIRSLSEDPIDEIFKIMNHVSTFLRKFNPVVFYDLQKFHLDAWQEMQNFQDKMMIGFVEENLKKGMKLGLYRKELNVKIIARLRMEEVNLGFNTTHFPVSSFSPAEVQIALFEHFLHGIVTLKGHQLIDKYKIN